MKKIDRPINYIFFGLVFLFLISTSFINFFSIEEQQLISKLSFSLHTLLQALLEVLLLIIIGSLIKRLFSKIGYFSFVGLTFIILLAQFANFIMLRLMDITLLFGLKLFWGIDINSFFVILRALNINPTLTIIAAAVICSLPLVGIGLYYLTYKISQRKPLLIKSSALSSILFANILLLFILDFSTAFFFKKNDDPKYKNRLPLTTTLLTSSQPLASFSSPLKGIRDEEKVSKILKKKNFTCTYRPNIYLFIIEALRRDCITKEIAPNLFKFQKENLSFDLSLSNSNSSHISWFSILHANFPLYWQICQKNYTKGSIPLTILKKMGYQITVISSAELKYLNIDEVLFGKNRSLADNFYDFSETPNLADYIKDKKTIDRLCSHDVKSSNLFIIFLDSTHSEYSFPENFPRKFSPISPKIDYLDIAFTKKNINLIKNRYFNSINYLDTLFGKFIHNLKKKNLLKDAIIVITADHAEEFFEEGALFHSTHLNSYQTSIPIFYKFPLSLIKNAPTCKMTSQMDIFPTLLHVLSGEDQFSHLFDGESLFTKKRWPYVLSAGYNAGDSPSYFFIHNGKERIHCHLEKRREEYLNIIAVMDLQDHKIEIENSKHLQNYLDENFKGALNILLQSKPHLH